MVRHTLSPWMWPASWMLLGMMVMGLAGVLEEPKQVGFSGLLQLHDRWALEARVHLGPAPSRAPGIGGAAYGSVAPLTSGRVGSRAAPRCQVSSGAAASCRLWRVGSCRLPWWAVARQALAAHWLPRRVLHVGHAHRNPQAQLSGPTQ